jgi:hypothetical protein
MSTAAGKSDLRNHQAITSTTAVVRLLDGYADHSKYNRVIYDCLMVTQITLKTEGPHGLPSLAGRRTEDPLYPDLIILTDYDRGSAFQSLERSEPRERSASIEPPTPRDADAPGTTYQARL